VFVSSCHHSMGSGTALLLDGGEMGGEQSYCRWLHHTGTHRGNFTTIPPSPPPPLPPWPALNGGNIVTRCIYIYMHVGVGVLVMMQSGLSCFLVPRWLPDGTFNKGLRIRGLKRAKCGDTCQYSCMMILVVVLVVLPSYMY